MADLSKGEKEKLIKEWKIEQNKDYILTQENVKDLFEFLENRLNASYCDHTLRYTEKWLCDHIPFEMVKSAISEITDMGGYCDCEVLLNCYEDYDIG